MSKSHADIFSAKMEAQLKLLSSIRERTEQFVQEIERRNEGFSKALEEYVSHNRINTEFLKIDEKWLEALNKDNGQKASGLKKTTNNKYNEGIIPGVSVKLEKLSEGYQSGVESTSTESMTTVSDIKENIKIEKEDMPAPTFIPPKKKVKESTARVTRTKGKKVRETKNSRESDVVLQQQPIPVVTLTDSEEDVPTRSTRTKTRNNKVTEASQDHGTEAENSVVKETRSTRTKTLRGGKKADEEEVVVPTETRSTRTKTIRKDPNSTVDKPPEETEQPPTRSTRTKTIKKPIVEETPAESTAVDAPTRSTRTKTRNVPATHEEATAVVHESTAANPPTKRLRSRSMDHDPLEKETKKKSTSPTPEDANVTTKTEYEDAESSPEPVKDPTLNATYVTGTQNPPPAANTTVIVEKPKFNIFGKAPSPGSFLTDDDSRELQVTPAKKPPVKSSKEVFSPYEKTTLKKKVEAFEKLQTISDVPVKASSGPKGVTTPSVKEKAKLFTPMGSKFMPSSSSTSKITRLISHQQSVASNESLLAMKSAQKDSRDKQRRLLEREQALKKKEAMLQAQAEAKRKLNEEKQLKAQQQRKALEIEKLKQLELQKQKEERLKKRELEREEYLLKQKMEAEKKRLAQKKKIQEMQAQREQMLAEQNKNPPTYMTTRPPRLPTEDCYDSDDPCYREVDPPAWCSDDYSRIAQLAMLTAGDKIKNTLFCRHAQTPDLKEIFEVIDPVKLKRTSSILWRKQPRYTMMPDLNETKFSEDDELYDSD